MLHVMPLALMAALPGPARAAEPAKPSPKPPDYHAEIPRLEAAVKRDDAGAAESHPLPRYVSVRERDRYRVKAAPAGASWVRFLRAWS
jgi:hypothetical protein